MGDPMLPGGLSVNLGWSGLDDLIALECECPFQPEVPEQVHMYVSSTLFVVRDS